MLGNLFVEFKMFVNLEVMVKIILPLTLRKTLILETLA